MSTPPESIEQLKTANDEQFDALYPAPVRELSADHWSPIDVARRAATFLAPSTSTRVLDIGSGAGKFCLVGGACTGAHFTGVEQRENLVELSSELAAKFHLSNVTFRRANILDVDFSEFEAFYFFNSFHENRSPRKRIDDTVEIGTAHYAKYSAYVTRALSFTPPGTRLVTYWTCLWDIPAKFRRVSSEFDGLLDLWEKSD